MKIARFWNLTRMEVKRPDGRRFDVSTWGWSENNAAEALQRSEESSRRMAERISTGQPFPDRYISYGDRPAREEILNETTDETGKTIAMVTRNRYGAIVLNTSDMMFIDVDVRPDRPPGLLDAIKGLFGSRKPDNFTVTLEHILQTARTMSQYTFRIYRTHSGFRCAVINKRIKPGSTESEDLFAAFRSDPLYVQLSKNQESFRARLTPKPWRCDQDAPYFSFPFANEGVEKMYRKWEREYAAAAEPYATCSFIEQIGNDRVVADFRALLEMHDKETKASVGLPLA